MPKRFTKAEPCPICGGHPFLPSGKGVRCVGYYDDKREYARCTREEYAGGISANPGDAVPTYSHRLQGQCHCGKTHGNASGPERDRELCHMEWRFVDATGATFVHHRIDYALAPKKMYWQPKGSHPSEYLYLDKVGPLDTSILLVEGEHCADIAAGALSIGVAGTVCGAPTVPSIEALRPLAGATVYLWPDNDPEGRAQMLGVAERLALLGCTTRWVTWPDAPAKGDVVDYLSGHTAPELDALVQTATPDPPRKNELWKPAMTPQSMQVAVPEADSAAFYGLVDQVTKVLAPFVESDEASILVQFLAAFGVAVGQSPHFMVGATRHSPLLYLGLIGRSSRSRKGTSWDPVEQLFRSADTTGFADRVISGVGSGERLVWLVKDSSDGSQDKRLLLQEPELARLLAVVNREGSTLSSYLRSAYDGRPIRNEVKNDGSVANTHHIGLIGHCTSDELKKQLKEQQIRNGLGNRIMWFLAKRGPRLPDPPDFEGREVADLKSQLSKCLNKARNVNQMHRSKDAQSIWADWYLHLPDEEEAGVVAALTDRAEAQVLRLSTIYALTDHSATIEAWHLTAALALWDYSTACVRSIWGGSTGDALADQVYDDLRFGPLYQTQVNKDLFGGNIRAERLVEIRVLLESLGLITVDYEHNGRPGRPSMRWTRVEPWRG